MIRSLATIVICLCFLLPSPSIQAIEVGNWDLIPYPQFWGAGLSAIYNGWSLVEDQRTQILLGLSGAYESEAYYRKPSGEPYTPPDPAPFLASGDAGYKKVGVTVTSGIRQGIAVDHRLSVFMLYRSYLDINSPDNALIFSSRLPDRDGIWQNSITSGVIYDNVESDPAHGSRQGISVEFSVESAPEFLGNNVFGKADYGRVTAKLISHGTLFDLDPESPRNLLNLVLSTRTVFDLLWGSYIPVNALQSVGGYYNSSGLGGTVRALQGGRHDGPLKITQNIDLRVNLPSIWLIVPALVIYGDVGISDDSRIGRIDEAAHFHSSTGAGLLLNFSGFDMGVFGDFSFAERTVSMSVAFGSAY